MIRQLKTQTMMEVVKMQYHRVLEPERFRLQKARRGRQRELRILEAQRHVQGHASDVFTLQAS